METVDDMFLPNLIIAAKRAGRSSASNGLDQIRPASEFQRLLDRERSRCDRTGEEFSVVIFTPSDPRTRSDVLHHLARSLSRRLRRTDDAGWMGVDRLGVLLPCTLAQGAWKVADGTCLGFPAGLPLPVCEVYSYPSGPWQGGDRKLPPLEVGPDSPHRTVQGMEQLFCQALPLWKRILDVVVAGSALVLLSPLLAIVAAAVKLTSPGPVFFRQLRSGLGGSRFFMYKFRSMRNDSERNGAQFAQKGDARVTAIGLFMRRTRIDELPQLWNILKGDMSLIGPRPERPKPARGAPAS